MNVSIGMMFMWILVWAWSILSIKSIFRPVTELPPIKEKDKESTIGAAAILIVIIAVFNISYYAISSGIVGNPFFTLISAVLIFGWIRSAWRALIKFGQYVNGQLPLQETKLTWWTVVNIIQLVWFGYFILFK